MHADELNVCLSEKDRALKEALKFFEACVPEEDRKEFKVKAKKLFPQLTRELESLRIELNKDPVLVYTYSMSCNRYLFVFKELVRKVRISGLKA